MEISADLIGGPEVTNAGQFQNDFFKIVFLASPFLLKSLCLIDSPDVFLNVTQSMRTRTCCYTLN